MMEELTKKELAEAKKQARRLRITNIRRRIATGAVALVALFSGFALYRSVEQQMSVTNTSGQLSGAATTASVSSDDSGEELDAVVGGVIVDQVASVLGDDDDDEGSSASSTSSPAPLTSSQS